jgi:hypothetical protein
MGNIEAGKRWMATHETVLELERVPRGFRCWSKIMKHLIRFGIHENKFPRLKRLEAVTAVYEGLRGYVTKEEEWKSYKKKCSKYMASSPPLQDHFMALCRAEEQPTISSITCNS